VGLEAKKKKKFPEFCIPIIFKGEFLLLHRMKIALS
jgi:hypothetical protein